jgi:hypothetical protein
MGTGLFPESKSAEVWHWTPTPSSAKIKQRVKPYLYSPSGNSWHFLGWKLPFIYDIYVFKLVASMFRTKTEIFYLKLA